jgi:small subunit ribosomal protein SAe
VAPPLCVCSSLVCMVDAQMRGTLAPGQPWDVVVDLFFYREPEETKEEGEDAPAETFAAPVDAGYGGAAGLPAPPGESCCPARPPHIFWAPRLSGFGRSSNSGCVSAVW